MDHKGRGDNAVAIDNSTDMISCCSTQKGGPYKVLREFAVTIPSIEEKVNRNIQSNALAPFEDTNHSIISPQETSDIQRYIHNTSLLVHDLDHAIYALQNVRNRLDRSTTECKRFVSAVGRLPVEILSDIFLLARPQYHGLLLHSHPSIQKDFQASFSPAQVCRRWRNIALGTPRLWNTIHLIGTKDVSQSSTPAPFKMLSRTSSIPAYLVIGLPIAHVRFLQRCANNGILSPFERQCKGLDIYAIQDSKKKHRSFPYRQVQDWLRRFQRLEKLTLLDVKLPWGPTDKRIPCLGLTHLHLQLHAGNSADIEPFLRDSDMPQLKVLVISLSHWMGLRVGPTISRYPELTDFSLRGQILSDPHHYSHERLQRVTICSSADNIERFTATATLPSLTELGISFYETMEEHLSAFLRRSGCPIDRLVFISEDLGSALYHRLKNVAINIGENLEIRNVEFDEEWEKSRMLLELQARWYDGQMR